MKETKTIAIVNYKGGTGKTTTTLNLGAALVNKGYKVLLIDFDGQGNLTKAVTGLKNIDTYKNNENVPAVIKIDKDGKKVNAKRTSLKKRDINTRISAPAIFYGYGNSYMFNKKLITVGSSPTWNGYEKEVMSYLNRNDITKVLGGRWTSEYRNVNGKWIRYANYDVLRKDSISEATFTENEENRTYYTADVEYKDPNEIGRAHV